MTRAALACLLAGLALLPWMKPSLELFGSGLILADLAFLAAALFALPRVFGALPSFLADPIGRSIALFAILVTAAALLAPSLDGAAARLLILAYGCGLALLAATLVDSDQCARQAILAWLAGTAVTCLVGVAALAMHFAGFANAFTDWALHHFGSLPPGPYRRVEATFEFPAMLANYLGVSSVMLVIAWQRAWIGRATATTLAALIGVTALFTLTPGLGAMLATLLIAISWGLGRPWKAVALAGTGVLVASLIAAAALGEATTVRWLTWSDSLARWIAHPVAGAGIGADAADVAFKAPSGALHHLTDAHNVFLNIAAHSGLVGLAGLGVLLAAVGRLTLRSAPASLPRLLGIAWLGSFALQGLTGSYEDARHLWLLLGLLVATAQAQHRSMAEQDTVNHRLT